VVWQLYQLVASAADADAMAEKLRAGGYGWGHAKKDLLDALVDGFAQERDDFNRWMSDKAMLDAELAKGAERARAVAQPVLQRVRSKIGF
jgi:tryptophanyl-tRNA synthetase